MGRSTAAQELGNAELWATKLHVASKDELQSTIAGLTADEHRKLGKALGAHESAASGTLPESITTDGLRVMMKDKMLAATETGELQSCLEGVLYAAAAPTDEDLRAKMRACIVNASETGELASVLRLVVAPKDSATNLPVRISTALDAALVSGDLAETVEDLARVLRKVSA